MKKRYALLFTFALLMLSSCNSAVAQSTISQQEMRASAPETARPAFPTPTRAASPTRTPAVATRSPTPADALPAATVAGPPPTLAPSPTRRPTLGPDGWKTLPVVPTISDAVLQIYQRGLELGNNPNAFSKIGDCGSTPAWFLGDFDRGPDFYRLGEYDELQAVIDAFQGSYGRTSQAARSGFNAPSLLVPLWADRTYCQSNEAPLACEYRLHRPVIAFIMLGTNDVWHPTEFEPQMRKIIEFSIQNGVIPILATKADNQEGDGSINATIARLAYEYDIPLWNYWKAANALPNHGLQEDLAHLTWGRNFFDDPEAMSKAWPVRNLTALQVLDAVFQKVSRR
jgi:hypothetical protein